MDSKQQSQTWSRLRSPTFLIFCGFLVITAFFLLTEHRAHVFGILPFVLLLLCPILHILMHRKHGGYGRDEGHPGHPDAGKRNPGGER